VAARSWKRKRLNPPRPGGSGILRRYSSTGVLGTMAREAFERDNSASWGSKLRSTRFGPVPTSFRLIGDADLRNRYITRETVLQYKPEAFSGSEVTGHSLRVGLVFMRYWVTVSTSATVASARGGRTRAAIGITGLARRLPTRSLPRWKNDRKPTSKYPVERSRTRHHPNQRVLYQDELARDRSIVLRRSPADTGARCGGGVDRKCSTGTASVANFFRPLCRF